MHTDVLHQKSGEQDWSESFYFNFYDRENSLCAFMRIGLKPDRDDKSMFCFLMLPDGTVAGINAHEPCNPELNAGSLKFCQAEPEKRWTLKYDGYMAFLPEKRPVRVAFDLEFESQNRMFDYRECVSGHKEEISKSVASEHLEQFGKVSGKLAAGGKEYSIRGLGERDHSWGVRDWNAPKMWTWLTAEFSETKALNVTKLVVEQGVVDAGFIHKDGVNIPVMEAVIDTTFGPQGAPASLKMTLRDKKGIGYEVTAEVVRHVAVPFESPDGKALSIMYETLAKYSFEGSTGYGIAEYLVKKS